MDNATRLKMQTQYILFSKPIDDKTITWLVDQVLKFERDRKCKKIYLLMNSTGGFNKPAIYGYNILSGIHTELITHNVGVVESIANILYLVGSRRIATPTSTFMFHELNWTYENPTVLSRSVLHSHLKSLDRDAEIVKQIYESRAEITDSSFVFPKQDTRISASAVREHGIVHEISPLDVPGGTIIHRI